MSRVPRRVPWPLVFVAASVALLCASAAAAGEAAQASPQVLLKDRQGLCLIIGCSADGDRLITDLAAGSCMLVHVVTLDDASLERVRGCIERAGIAGQVAAERLSLKPLPFVSDLANAVIVEQPAEAAAAGLTPEEIQRVTAPFGTVFTRKGAGWTASAKPLPAEMDAWPQVHHGADLNRVSKDKRLVKGLGSTMGLRWLEGPPVNATGCSGSIAWVVAGGRCYTYGVNEHENLPNTRLVTNLPQYVSARDAFNGMPLWKVATGTQDDGVSIGWTSEGPLVADETGVWAGTNDGVLCLDGATGKELAVCKTAHAPRRLILIDGVVIAASWQDRTRAGYRWTPKGADGAVEAFDAATGAKKWTFPAAAYRVAAEGTAKAGGVVYALILANGAPATAEIAAVELATGNVRWRKAAAELGGESRLDLCTAGPGFLSVLAISGRSAFIHVLGAADGKLLWKSPCHSSGTWTPLVDGLLWVGDKRCEALTGAVKGSFQGGFYNPAICTHPAPLVPPYYGFGEITIDGKKSGTFGQGKQGFRTACGEQFVPAYGMVYIPQTYCKCVPGQVYGMMAMGETVPWPDEEDFAKKRAVEKGPAFGQAKTATTEEWPTYRGDAERSASTKSDAPDKLNKIWEVSLANPDGPLAPAWKPQTTSPLTPPVIAGGTLLVAATDAGQVFALDAASGKKLWTKTLPSRIDSPPTISNGLALVGCHDGWCYALRLEDGQLAWRARVAPTEQRMVAWGKVESNWPAVGSVLVADGTAYVTAGRTADYEGGVAMTALDARTGDTRWARSIREAYRINDLLSMGPDGLAWHHLRFEAKDGRQTAPTEPDKLANYGGGAGFVPGGILDCTWTQTLNRRARTAYSRGKVRADMVAWNADVFVTAKDLRSSKDGAILWRTGYSVSRQAEALVIAGSKVVFAGADTRQTPQRFFLTMHALKDGEKLAEIPLEARPALNGLAVAGGRLYVSLYNGRMLCFGP